MAGIMNWWQWMLTLVVAILVLIAIRDVTQKKHSILRNFPLIGHLRYLLETIGPELRQYIVTSNNEERPFSRDQRRWVYASAKLQNNYFGFGTDKDVELSPNHLVIKHSAFPISTLRKNELGYDPLHSIPAAKVLGRHRDRKHKFRPESIVNISAMSYGSLSSAAVESINRGCEQSQCLHNTGEGGISPFHMHGGKLIWQLGTGYFGARAADGGFSEEKFRQTLEKAAGKVKAIEIKFSQGAKPGLGGMLPGAKVTPEIAKIRGIPVGKDCASPAFHSAFSNVDEMLDFIEGLAEISGLPVGIKSAVGEISFWDELISQMISGTRGVDYIAIDGSEGGTGAAPLAFSDHVALPFKLGFTRVYRRFEEAGLADAIFFMGSGKLGFPESGLLALSLGCDALSIAREPMLAIGCIQAQQCHSGHCPTGVATQNKWLMRGLDPTLKSNRLANYLITLRKEIMQLTHACGFEHPAQITPSQFEIADARYGSQNVADIFNYEDDWGHPAQTDIQAVLDVMHNAEELRRTA
tara:strand:- start:1642 stop:3213 length:1572 start_codon:yes stop_codon:yes gene_type:complete